MESLLSSVEIRSDNGISFEESLFIAEEQTQVEIIPSIKMEKKLIFSVSLNSFGKKKATDVIIIIVIRLKSAHLCLIKKAKYLYGLQNI